MVSKKGSKKGNKADKGDKSLDIDVFAPEIRKVLTAKHLLSSPEDLVVMKALMAIEKFVRNAISTQLQYLYDNGIVPQLYELIPRALNIRRFALKLIVIFTKEMPELEKQLPENYYYMNLIIQCVQETGDETVLELATYLLKICCTNDENRIKIILPDIINKLQNLVFSSKSQSKNPDLMLNCLELFYQMLITSQSSKFIDNCPQPELYLCLLKNPYKEIQTAGLNMIFAIANLNDDTLVKRLRENNLIQKFYQTMIGLTEWGNEHNRMLDIIVACIRNQNVENKEVESLDFIKLLRYISEEDANSSVVLATVAIISEYAKNEFSRQVLYDFRVHELLIKLLDVDCDLTKVKVCEAIQYMIINTCLAQEIANKSLVAAFTRLMSREDLTWSPYRLAPVKSIYEMSFYSPKIPLLLYQCNTLKTLRQAIMNRNEITKPEFLRIIQIYQQLLSNRPIRKYILTEDVYPELLSLVFDEDKQIAKIAFRVIEDTIPLQKCQIWFRKYGGIQVVIDLLKQQPNFLMEEVTNFLEECLRYKCIALDLLHADVINHISKLRKFSYPPYEGIGLRDNFYSYDLSMKFFKQKHLSVSDITKNGFYIFLGTMPESFRLDDYPIELSPCYTCLTVTFKGKSLIKVPVHPPRDSITIHSNNQIPGSTNQGSKVSNQPVISHHGDSQNLETDLDSGQVYELVIPDPPATLEYDYYLHNCLRRAKKFLSNESTPEEKITKLAIFVARQLSGNSNKDLGLPSAVDCKLHYTALKNRVQSNIVPLGLLRYGLFMERALLFKVLADRLAILAELYRNHDIGWCEVPLFQKTASSDMWVIEKYIIDLMYDIGKFMKRDNWDALAYVKGSQEQFRKQDCGFKDRTVFPNISNFLETSNQNVNCDDQN